MQLPGAGRSPLVEDAAARRTRRHRHGASRRPHAGAHPRSRRSAGPELAPLFDTDAIFFDIRLEPYLLATAQQHPDLAQRLAARWWRRRRPNKRALVHGDVSPKNILIGPHRPGAAGRRMRLVGRPGLRPGVLPEPPAAEVPVDARRREATSWLGSRCWPRPTLHGVDWEPREALEHRAAALLPGLLLARVDGKSPVEYLTADTQRDAVRRVARAAVAATRDPSGRRQCRLAAGTRTMTAATHHPHRARPPRVGQPRPPHRGSRGAPARRRHGPRHRAGRRQQGHRARRSSCVTAASASAAWTCSAPSAHVNGEIARRGDRPGCRRPGRARRAR